MEEHDHSPRLVVWVVAVALIAGMAGGLTGAALVHVLSDDGPAPSQAAATIEQRQVTLEEDSAVTDTVEKAVPSVVTIVNKLATGDGFGLQTEETAAGSGVIIDSRGFIVTNEHVVRGAAEITVVLHDGRDFPATLVSADDPFTDLAVIKIDPGAGELPALSWGDSDLMKLGQRVVAIGSALNEFRDSVTVGVISGSHRNWSREGVVMEDLIQTDAAVNHGNSGGALLNAEGELVGLNTSVIRSTETGELVEGIAFAISSNVAAPITHVIIDQGSYPRAYLGIAHQDITPDVSTLGDLPVDHGALVARVSPGTPAADAGIKEGDIILQMGDVELNRDMPFLNALGRLQPGQPVVLVLDRAGDEVTVLVTPLARDRTTG
ncbi:MAG: trypsin-like peptidase domain-containing protein [Dehalococcoidia bacterium]|jgi:S1-C subfamily serine protease|nr:trypsin-like peptidase domain-containing protein [Dehalococcoidia bacterium]